MSREKAIGQWRERYPSRPCVCSVTCYIMSCPQSTLPLSHSHRPKQRQRSYSLPGLGASRVKGSALTFTHNTEGITFHGIQFQSYTTSACVSCTSQPINGFSRLDVHAVLFVRYY
ncbi:hypothetical protein J6590_008372 [Homalodisca vitripennis]|nr:hypothetical protein J6590_008372 [Homalodisca vitripennis]